jgi:methylglutaconyl-CoA hydratase
MLTGERLTAAEAKRIGFVHECVPAAELDGAVERLCAHLAQGGPEALARTKKLLAHVEAAPLTPALAAETAAALAEARASAEAREGMRSFLEKRKPGWQ